MEESRRKVLEEVRGGNLTEEEDLASNESRDTSATATRGKMEHKYT